MSDTTENLDNFAGFGEEAPKIDFFGDNPEEIETPAPVASEEEAGKETPSGEGEEPKPKPKEKEGEEAIDFFGSGSEEEEAPAGEESGSEEEDGDEPADSIESSVSTLSFLKEKGLVEFELEEDQELTPELAEEILEDSLDNKVESRIEELFGELPDVVKELNKYVMNGGDIDKFFGSVSKQNSVGITKDLDLTQENNQELVVRNQLKAEGYDQDYIDSQIEFLKDSKRLEKTSETHFNKWKTKNEAEQAAILKSQQDAQKVAKENRRKLKAQVSSFLKETEELNGFKLNAKEKKELPNYMTDRTVRLENGNSVTPMQKDLYAALQDSEKSVLLAKLLKNNFDFKDITKKAETKVVKEVKENIRRSKTVTPSKSATGKSQPKKNLADFF